MSSMIKKIESNPITRHYEPNLWQCDCLLRGSEVLHSSKNDILDSIVGLYSIETLTSDKLESAPAEQRVILGTTKTNPMLE